MCLVQSRINVAEDAVLVNSIIGEDVHIDCATAVVNCHLTSPVHVNSGCIVSGLNDSDISVSNSNCYQLRCLRITCLFVLFAVSFFILCSELYVYVCTSLT